MERRKRLFVALGILAVGALASAPWQLKQWQALQKARQETAQQEASLQVLRNEHDSIQGAKQVTSQDPVALLKAARILLESGDSRSALPRLKQLHTNPDLPTTIKAQIAGLYQQVGKVHLSYQMLNEVIRQEPENVEALLHLGYLEMSLGYRVAARTHLDQAAKLAPDRVEPLLAIAFYSDHDLGKREAEKYLRKAITLKPEQWTTHVILANNLTEQGRHQEALAVLQALPPDYAKEAAPLAQKARTLVAQSEKASTEKKSQLMAAEQCLKQALNKAPRDGSLYTLLGQVYRKLGQEQKAIAAFEQAYQINPIQPQLAWQYSQVLIRAKQQTKAEAILRDEKLRTKDDSSFQALVLKMGAGHNEDIALRRELARWCGSHQKLSRALLEWERILQDFPGDVEATQEIERLSKLEIE